MENFNLLGAGVGLIKSWNWFLYNTFPPFYRAVIPDNKIYAGDIPEGETELTTAANKTLTVVKKWVCAAWESSRTLKIL